MTPFLKPKDGAGWAIVRAGTFTGHKTKSRAKELLEEARELYRGTKWWLLQVKIDAEFEANEDLSDRDKINALGDSLRLLRQERALVIEVVAPDSECPDGSFKVTVSDGEYQGVWTAVELQDALSGASKQMNGQKNLIETVSVEEAKPVEAPKPKLSAAGLKVKR
jgi:hypothetical protein